MNKNMRILHRIDWMNTLTLNIISQQGSNSFNTLFWKDSCMYAYKVEYLPTIQVNFLLFVQAIIIFR